MALPLETPVLALRSFAQKRIIRNPTTLLPSSVEGVDPRPSRQLFLSFLFLRFLLCLDLSLGPEMEHQFFNPLMIREGYLRLPRSSMKLTEREILRGKPLAFRQGMPPRFPPQ